MTIKTILRRILLFVARVFGADIYDIHTGKIIGRALLVAWNGRIIIIGGQDYFLIPEFRPQTRLTYWRQELGFTIHSQPDFENVRPRP